MSRRPMAFGVPCHDDAEWTCNLCERAICGECDGIDNGSGLCWSCFNPDIPGDAA